MSGRDLARKLLEGDPAAAEIFFSRYGRSLEKAVTGAQLRDLGNAIPLPLFSKRVAVIAARLVLAEDDAGGARVGDPFPEALGVLRLGELYLASAAAFGSAAAAAIVAERRSALSGEFGAGCIDFAAYDGLSPLLVFSCVSSAAPRPSGCPDAAALAAHAARSESLRDPARFGDDAAASGGVERHVRSCAPCRDLASRALEAMRRAAPARPVTLPPAPSRAAARRVARALAVLGVLLALAAAALLYRGFGD